MNTKAELIIFLIVFPSCGYWLLGFCSGLCLEMTLISPSNLPLYLGVTWEQRTALGGWHQFVAIVEYWPSLVVGSVMWGWERKWGFRPEWLSQSLAPDRSLLHMFDSKLGGHGNWGLGLGTALGIRCIAEALISDTTSDLGLGCIYWDRPSDTASSQNVVPDQHHRGTGKKCGILRFTPS